MTTPYLGDIRMFGGNFAPVGWAYCDGSLLPISQNPGLYQLLGTTFGGDGNTTFALPNLLGRVPIHVNGSTYRLGQSGGNEQATLTTEQIPQHTHALNATTSSADTKDPSGAVLASGNTVYFAATLAPTQLAQKAVGQTGGNAPHENRMPFQAVNYIIATEGIYPSQN